MDSLLVPMTETDFVSPEPTDADFVVARLGYGIPPETITRELVRRGHKPLDAQRVVKQVVRNDRNR